MATNQLNNAVRYLRKIALLHQEAALTDGQLLDRFIACQESAAFEALVRRYGPMVLGVCRRVLHHEQDAEDAFQATFLVMVRKASSIVPREKVGDWLYGVAYRTALKARAANARRRRRHRQFAEIQPSASAESPWHDLQPVLDRELSRLPEKYRIPLLLCDLEGKPRKVAARQLGWPEGTLSGRLARARTMLAKRLSRHGFSIVGGSLAIVLSENAASASVPASLLLATVKAAAYLVAGQALAVGMISAKVTALMEGVLETMLVSKLKTAAVVCLAVGMLGVGVGMSGFCYPTHAAEEQTAPSPTPVPTPPEGSKTNPTDPPARPSQPSPASAYTEPKQTEYVMQIQLFEVGPHGRIRAASPYERHALKKGGPERVPLFASITAHDFEQRNKEKTPLYEAFEAGVSYVVTLKELSPPHVLLDLALTKEDVEHQQKDKDGVMVWGRTLHLLRTIEIGKLERFTLEKDSQGRPASWLELCLVRDPGTEQIPWRGPGHLPFSVGRNVAKEESLKTELEGIWKPVKTEIGGSPVAGAAAMKQFGKLGIKGNRLFSPDRPPLEAMWHGWFRLDPGKTPKRITIFDESLEGPMKLHGIYAVEGDELKICLNTNGKDSTVPDDFRTKEGSSFMLVHFRREKR